MGLMLSEVAIHLDGRCLIPPITLEVAPARIVTVMGPSGCGKSSLLAYIAGDIAAPLEGSGTVTLNGHDLATLTPERRRIGRLFQDDLLFPHMTVAENLLFGMPRGDAAARHDRMEAALAEAGLAGFGPRAPHTLSGGQRSRVALLRTLLAEPLAVLLDEPFSRLDTELRESLRGFVFSHLAERNIPALMVTHDAADIPPGGQVLRIDGNGEARHA